MSISSLGRSIAAPSLREPVSPLTTAERHAQTKSPNSDLATTQVSQKVSASSEAQVEQSTHKPRVEVFENKPSFSGEQSTADAVAEMTDLLHRRNVEVSATGPLNRPDFKVIDRVNNIDFERAISTQALRDRIFEMREAFIADLSKDTISFDLTSPLGRRVLVIKDNINEAEFVRHLPRSYNEERVAHLTSFCFGARL
jgi:hypothetical protein